MWVSNDWTQTKVCKRVIDTLSKGDNDVERYAEKERRGGEEEERGDEMRRLFGHRPGTLSAARCANTASSVPLKIM